MRLSLAPLLLGLLMASPAAAALTHFVGPVTTTTSNVDEDGACGSGKSTHTRDARSEIEIDRRNRVVVQFSQWCHDQGSNGWYSHSNSTAVYVARYGPGQSTGPTVAATWSRYHSPFMEQCDLSLYAMGPMFRPGCPTLDGQAPPMLPPLP